MSRANRRRRPKQPPPPRQPPPTEPAKKGPLRQLWSRWWGKALAVYTAFATLATVLAGVDFFRQIYEATVPEVTAPTSSDEASPLAAPFSITNRSAIFTLHDVIMNCHFDFLELRSGTQALRNTN